MLEHNGVTVAPNISKADTISSMIENCVSGPSSNRDFRSAFHAQSRDEFKKRMQDVYSTYSQKGIVFARERKENWSSLFVARALFASYWISDKLEERKTILENIVQQTERALVIFSDQQEKEGVLEAGEDLLAYYDQLQTLQPENKSLKQLLEKSRSTGEHVIGELRRQKSNTRLLESLFHLVRLSTGLGIMVEGPQPKELMTNTSEIITEMSKLSEKIATPYAYCLSDLATALAALDFERDPKKSLEISRRAMPRAEALGDSYLTTELCCHAAFSTFYMSDFTESDGLERELFESQAELSLKAIRSAEIPLLGFLLDFSYYNYAAALKMLAVRVETDRESKKARLRKAVDASRTGMAYDGYNQYRNSAQALSGALYLLAKMTEGTEERANLLKEALHMRQHVHQGTELALLPEHWNNGRDHGNFAKIKAELSDFENDPATKIGLLEESVQDMKKCVTICTSPAYSEVMKRDNAEFLEAHGDILVKLYHLNHRSQTAHEAIRNYSEVIENLAKMGLVGLVATVRWKVAKMFDLLSDYQQASRAFQDSANDYRGLAREIPYSGQTFEDLASYLESWSFIEESRRAHNAEQYSVAAQSYSRAADKLEATQTWGHLADYYRGCSLLEQAEGLSRGEKHPACVEVLMRASQLFQRAGLHIRQRSRSPTALEEVGEVFDWIKVTDDSQQLCQGRLELEQARVLDKDGRDEDSAEKYVQASDIFRRLSDAAQETTRNEFETLALFSEAWARMKRAELDVSPELFAEAGRIFRETSDLDIRGGSRLLALANASICDALEAGTRFHLNHDVRFYGKIKRHLETAASLYERGGFAGAAEWTHATQRLFDALVYVTDAETERDAAKKTDLFRLAEKYLDMSARLYGVAGYPARKKNVMKQLNKIREENKLLLSPIDALRENPAVGRVVPASVSLITDKAEGLERLDPARIVGNVSVAFTNIVAGSRFPVELEMVNIGRTAAILIKFEGFANGGVEVDPDKNPQLNPDLSLRVGRRLEYLQTYKETIWLKAVNHGKFEVRSRVTYADETGNYRSHEFQNLQVSVDPAASGFRSAPSPIMGFLAKAFVEDYMVRRLTSEHAGWRSLTDVVEALKIPKAHVYGDSRYGHTFGKPLDELVKSGIVEYRIVPGVRGRGGNAMKIRVAYDRAPVKKIVDELALRPVGYS